MPSYDIRDGLHRKVPERFKLIFNGRAKMVHWASTLGAASTRLGNMAREPWCKNLDVMAVQKVLDSVRSAVIRAAPYVPCNCPPHEHDCDRCDGERWLTIDQSHGTSSPPLPS